MLRSPFGDRRRALDPNSTTIDNDCYEDFGDTWWAEKGPVGGLHAMNPARCRYFDAVFRRELGPKDEARILDVGCGGGILTEAMAARGWQMTGVDLSPKSIEVARRHAEESGVEVEYQVGSAYELPFDDASIDAVVISDVLEHLHDLPRSVREIARVLKPRGVMAFDTINRTPLSYVLMIVLAQGVLRLAPPRTHDWRMFIKPEELRAVMDEQGISPREAHGLVPQGGIKGVVNRLVRTRNLGDFDLSGDLQNLYIGYGIRREATT